MFIPKHARTLARGVSTHHCQFCTNARACFKLRDGPIDWWFCDVDCCTEWVEHRHEPKLHQLLCTRQRRTRVSLAQDPETRQLIYSHCRSTDATEAIQSADRHIAWYRLCTHSVLPVLEDLALPSSFVLWNDCRRRSTRRG